MTLSPAPESRRRRITVTELLIGGSVLLVAVCLIVAWISSKKQSARGAESARNLMQWGIALNLYLLENQNTLPEVGGDEVEAKDSSAWYNALPTYLSLQPLGELPLGKKPKPEEASIWVDPSIKVSDFTGYSAHYFCYAMNRWLQPDYSKGSYKIYDLFNPAAVVFLTEVAGVKPGAVAGDVVYRQGTKSAPTANVLFCDGHVEPVSRQLLGEGEAPDRVSWAPFDGAPEPGAVGLKKY